MVCLLAMCHSFQSPDILHPSTSLEWEEWPSLPVGMKDAHVVCMNETVFVGGGDASTLKHSSGTLRDAARLYSFKPGVDNTWIVTDTPTYWYVLTEHNSQLLLVGGREYSSGELTNKIFTAKDDNFVQALPSMNEKRSRPSALSTGSVLVVAGGVGTSGDLSSVEVFKDGQWVIAPPLPTAGFDVKSAFHGNKWYLFRGSGKVFLTSVHSLLAKEPQSQWETLPDPPNKYSAASFFGSHLLSIGGGYPNPTSAIYAFSFGSQSWEHVADLPVPLRKSSAGELSPRKLIIIGGIDKKDNISCQVFCAFIKGLCLSQQIIP